MQARSAHASKISASFVTLEEGFQQFGNDLNKLQVISICPSSCSLSDNGQQFVEINATAFSKILKKVSAKTVYLPVSSANSSSVGQNLKGSNESIPYICFA